MNIRTASFRDLTRIEQLYRDAIAFTEATGHIGVDSPVPQATLLRLWYGLSKTLSSLVPLADNGEVLFVAEDPNDGIVGFIQAQLVAGKAKAWQILNLCAPASGRSSFVCERLLSHLCSAALEHGVHRVHVVLPLDHPLVARFIEQGFTQFATEQILYADEGVTAPVVARTDLLRPARRDDAGAIYLLYLRNTPSHVAHIEGPNLKTWQSSFGQGTLNRLGRDDVRQLVAERSGIFGWAAIRGATATRPSILSLMCDGHDAGLRESLIDAVVEQLPPGPVSSVLRHYESELIRALQGRGFEIYGTQLLLVRDLGHKLRAPLAPARAKKKSVLVPAGLSQATRRPSARPGGLLDHLPPPRPPERREPSLPI